MKIYTTAALVAMAGMASAFAPSRSIIPAKLQVPTMVSRNSKFIQPSDPMEIKKSNTAIFMSDAAADIPEPEKKNLLGKVCSYVVFFSNCFQLDVVDIGFEVPGPSGSKHVQVS